MLGVMGIGVEAGVSIEAVMAFDVRLALKNGQVRSIVGHADTAALFTEVLGQAVAFNRESVKLVDGDVLLIGQYNGPRLPEGCHTLPEGATITWLKVIISYPATREQAKPMTLKEIGVDTQTINALAKIGVHTVDEVINLSRLDILRLPNIGKGLLRRLKTRLEFVGISYPW